MQNREDNEEKNLNTGPELFDHETISWNIDMVRRNFIDMIGG
jgi:hypothetical protein